MDDFLAETLAKCYTSTRTTSKVLFPDYFERPFTGLHDRIFEALDDDSKHRIVIKAPRGFGKTTIDNLAYPAKKILFKEKKFIVPISNTATQAIMQSENLKRELQANDIIRKLFGSVKAEGYENPFSKEMWVTSSGICVLPRGAGQQVRGIKYGRYRPDLIIGDDLEDSESVQSEEQRKKLKLWWFTDVMNSVDRGLKNWKVVVVGTLLHEDSLLANLLEDPSWHHIELSLCDENYKSNWPEFISDEEIQQLVESHRKQGILDAFYREYMGMPISIESASFSSQYFKYYDSDYELHTNKRLENIVIYDPAKTVQPDAAFTAILGISLDVENGKIYIRDIVNKRMHPPEQYSEVFGMVKRTHAKVLGVKATSLNEFIMYPIKTYMTQHDITDVELVEIPEHKDKDLRIKALIPLYRAGYVYHNRSACGPLEAQLLSWPRAKYKDVADAAADIVWMLEEGDRYFHPPTEMPTETERAKPAEEDFSEVEDDDYGDAIVANGTWRRI